LVGLNNQQDHIMKAKLIVLITVLFLTSVKTFAGWYSTFNYKGFIDRYPVTLSFQVKEGYFGEPAKKNYNVIGVYKYDKFNHPVRLEGVFNQSTQEINIYEIAISGKVSATFKLNFSAQKLTGIWSNGKNKLTVNLNLEDKLSDISDEAFENVQILQSPSLNNFYFVGVYTKKANDKDACMTSLKIISKANNKVFQTLHFEAIATPTGNLMTIIYDNVTTGKGDDFLVSNQIGRVGGYLSVRFNQKAKRFILNPNPIAEG